MVPTSLVIEVLQKAINPKGKNVRKRDLQNKATIPD